MCDAIVPSEPRPGGRRTHTHTHTFVVHTSTLIQSRSSSPSASSRAAASASSAVLAGTGERFGPSSSSSSSRFSSSSSSSARARLPRLSSSPASSASLSRSPDPPSPPSRRALPSALSESPPKSTSGPLAAADGTSVSSLASPMRVSPTPLCRMRSERVSGHVSGAVAATWDLDPPLPCAPPLHPFSSVPRAPRRQGGAGARAASGRGPRAACDAY